MIPELIAIALATAVGFALAVRLDRDGPLLGESVLLGFGACAALLFVLSLLHVAWNRWWLIGLGVGAAIVVWKCSGGLQPAIGGLKVAGGLKAAATLLMAIPILGYTLFATAGPLWEFDYLSDWGLKARVFSIARGIDWQFLEQATYRATHPDYPLLLPLSFDVLALIRGAWNDQALGLLNVAFAVALLMIVYRVALDETSSSVAAALVTFAMFPIAAVPWIGIGEGPFVAYATAGLLLMRRNMTIAAVMLGLAASTKNEGLALIVAAAIALLICRHAKDIMRLWPSAAIAAPWLIVRALHRLPTDIAAGSVLSRIADHLVDPGPLIEALEHASVGKPLMWIGLLLGALLVGRELVRRESFVLLALAIQFVFYLGAYVATPHDIAWHVRWSWDRLVWHLTPALAAVILTSLARVVVPAERRP